MTARVRRQLAMATVAIALTGCGVDNMSEDSDVAAAAAHMRAQPSLEDSVRRLQAVVDEILAESREISPGLDWQPHRTAGYTSLGCPAPFSDADGVSWELRRALSAVPIPASDWPRVLAEVTAIAARAGMTRVLTIRDGPDDHDVELKNTDNGDTIRFGTQVNALLTAVTGCRYKAGR